MEVITFGTSWGYTLIVVLVVIALVVFKGNGDFMPRPRKKDKWGR